MARKLKSFDWTERISSYPWEDWEDGSIWEIVHGEDFTVPVKSMQAQLYIRAKSTGRRVRVAYKEHNPETGSGSLIFQFSEAEPPKQTSKSARTAPT